MANKKSQDAKFQLHIWSRLLEGRIALQKVVVASRELTDNEQSQNDQAKTDSESAPQQTVDDSTIKSLSKLLTCLVRLRDTYRTRSQFNNENESVINQEDDENETTAINDPLLDIKHDDYDDVRNGIIEKWCEKTKIGSIPKKGYEALELPTSQLIINALKDRERLIRRTQLNRASHKDEDYNPQTFNDDDFYHHLLKEVISKEDNRKWVELQRLKYKTKRRADTKATKGRKIKKDLIPKLVNFMAPSRPVDQLGKEPIPDQIRVELIKSLFGGSILNK